MIFNSSHVVNHRSVSDNNTLGVSVEPEEYCMNDISFEDTEMASSGSSLLVVAFDGLSLSVASHLMVLVLCPESEATNNPRLKRVEVRANLAPASFAWLLNCSKLKRALALSRMLGG